MLTMRTILFPADGSACSKEAMAYALSLATQYGARIVVLHVIDERWLEQARPAVAADGHEVLRQMQQGQEAEARQLLQEATDAAAQARVTLETRFVTGVPFEEIVRMASALPADVIVMGTHGRTGVSHALLGSVAERVVRRAPCPVLTVRSGEAEVASPVVTAE